MVAREKDEAGVVSGHERRLRMSVALPSNSNSVYEECVCIYSQRTVAVMS